MYNLILSAAKILIRLLFDYRVIGSASVPKNGPIVLAANHVSGWDPLMVACALDRPVSYMAKEELFKLPVLGVLLPRILVFPVRRGKTDRAAVKRSIGILKDGGALGIFPQGTRHRKPEDRSFSGAAYFAAKTGALLVPVGIKYEQLLPFRKRATVRFGNPVEMGDAPNSTDTTTLNRRTEAIMERIFALASGDGEA